MTLESFRPRIYSTILDHTGYYIANNVKFNSKLQAILSLPKNNYDLKWYFHDHLFSRFNWLEEPSLTLDEAYALRAQQLRDTYDYLILCYSGGSDSNQILHTFVKNNIPLDEIHFHGSFKTDTTRLPISKHPSFKNIEIYHVAEPIVKELQKKWTHLKVDHYDWTENVQKFFQSDSNFDWLLEAGNSHFRPNFGGKFHLHKSLRQPLSTDYNKKKVAYIWGIDKPRIIKIDNRWYMYFVDAVYSSDTSPLTNETDELFYWSPHSEKLLIKQAHVLKRYIESDPIRHKFFETLTLSNFQVEQYYELVKPAIYPNSWDTRTYQTDKVSGTRTERDWWFYKNDQKSYINWLQGFNELRCLDPYWINANDINKGLRGCVSPFYQFA